MKKDKTKPYVLHVAEIIYLKVSEIKNIPFEEIAKHTHENASELFQLP